MADAVDAIRDLWRAERPDLDTWPSGVVGRIQRLNRVLDKELKSFYARFDLETWEFDVLTTLRRSGKPYELTAGALLKAAMVTSGAITNRIDRMAARGLVERVRDDQDRRSVRIRLTSHGHQVVDEVFGLHLANEVRLLQALTPAQRDNLVDALRTLLESFGDTSLT